MMIRHIDFPGRGLGTRTATALMKVLAPLRAMSFGRRANRGVDRLSPHALRDIGLERQSYLRGAPALAGLEPRTTFIDRSGRDRP